MVESNFKPILPEEGVKIILKGLDGHTMDDTGRTVGQWGDERLMAEHPAGPGRQPSGP